MKKKLCINNKEEFEKFASTITRKDFLKNHIKFDEESDDYAFIINKEWTTCPNEIGLYEDCVNQDICKICWMDCVKCIYFKDDIEKTSLIKSANQLNKVKELTEQNNTIYTFKNNSGKVIKQIKVENWITYERDSNIENWRKVCNINM